jgi:hypothetical protein
MCTSILGILKINCPEERNTNTINISMSALNQKISETIVKVNQESRNSYVLVQNQTVKLNGYPTYGVVPDLKILQSANLKLTDSTILKSTISVQDMTNLSNSIQTQFDDLLKGDSPFIKANTDNIVNLRKAITNVIKSSTTLQKAQESVSETLSVQNQDITINFAPGVPDAVIAELGADIVRTPGQRPVIQIDQNLVNDILKNTIISSIVSAIKNDKIVNETLAKFGSNADCEMTFAEDPCNMETQKTSLRGKVTQQPKGSGIKCLNLTQKQFPNITWRAVGANEFIATYPCTKKDETKTSDKTDVEKEIERELQENKSELEKQIERDIQQDTQKDTEKNKEESSKPPVENPPEKESQEQTQPQEKTEESKKDNTMMYIGLGVGVVVVLGFAYFLLRKKRE